MPKQGTFIRRLGGEKEAKAYIRKIQHETLRISVIQRLEEYFRPKEEDTPTVVETDDDDDRTRAPSPVKPDMGMWEDQCKRIFLWYYHIYLVVHLEERRC
jgi:ubiquitin-conjugating enzyme E2 Z